MLENMIFCPLKQSGRQIKELDLSVFNLVDDEPGNINVVSFVYKNETYNVNMDSIRYYVLKNNPSCSCCGIKTTRCFLEKDIQQTKERKTNVYHIQFYAETGQNHLVLMTQDHIVPKLHNGSDLIQNQQTLCFNCNSMKADINLTIEQMRHIISHAHRAYKASFMLNKAKEITKPLRYKIQRNLKAIDNIKKGLEIVHDERVLDMKSKISKLQNEINELLEKCNQVELESQITGICPLSV